MKADKALRKLERIEALMTAVVERYETSEQHVHEALGTAKDAIVRARIAVAAKPAIVQAPAREVASQKAIVKKAAKRPVAKAVTKTSLAKPTEKPARKKAAKPARSASGK